jgi:hypothetical protein
MSLFRSDFRDQQRGVGERSGWPPESRCGPATTRAAAGRWALESDLATRPVVTRLAEPKDLTWRLRATLGVTNQREGRRRRRTWRIE